MTQKRKDTEGKKTRENRARKLGKRKRKHGKKKRGQRQLSIKTSMVNMESWWKVTCSINNKNFTCGSKKSRK